MAQPLSREIPVFVRESPLWKNLASRTEYGDTLLKIRSVAGTLADKVSSEMPEYTGHSVVHMDALWRVSSEVLTTGEIERLTAAEALLLGSAFYLHDLGMAIAVTRSGKEEIRKTEQYKSAYERFRRINAPEEGKADSLALREATRQLHAQKALELATQPIPGLDRYLIEDSDFRSRWSYTIGQIAASHHWDLEDVERSLGVTKEAPSPDGDTMDLGYVACALRVIDFAHINRARAPILERALRPEMPLTSAVHWDSQANITGPKRDDDFLVFGSTEPMKKIDGWWLFYDLASALDSEIRSVHEYLRGRTVSAGRFSLKGVKGVESPTIFSECVRLSPEIVPIDIRVQPDSMERVVELLGGRHVYGDDRFPPFAS